MEDRRGEGGVGVTGREYVGEVLQLTGASGRDDWNVDSFGDGSREIAVEAGARAVPVHRRQQDLARTASLRLLGPVHHVAGGIRGAAADVNAKSIIQPLRIDCDD